MGLELRMWKRFWAEPVGVDILPVVVRERWGEGIYADLWFSRRSPVLLVLVAYFRILSVSYMMSFCFYRVSAVNVICYSLWEHQLKVTAHLINVTGSRAT